MATYWLSFRLENDATYALRYDALVETIRQQTTKWWPETTAFFVFESGRTIDQIAESVAEVIDERCDVVLCGMTDFKSARLIGNNQDNDIFDLIPFIKKV